MKNWEEKLRHARDRLQLLIDAAVRNGEEIEVDVRKWLTEVDEITELAKKVHEGEEEAKMRCSIEVCLSLKLRHQLSRKAQKIVKLVGEALENGKFDRFSYYPASQGILTTRYMDCMEFVSRMPTVKGLKDALGDANINVIGLWGMPGVGKTTLMREVARQVKEDKLFDEVALAHVTQSQDLRRIQGEIGDMLDLKLVEETMWGRAIRLQERLTKVQKKRILVILDDIWDKLDLDAIGIYPCKGCKVVLVSRQRDLLSEMGVQKNFGIEVLPEKEAWELFEKMAADSVKDPNLRSIATEVAKECGGLPVALATVSKALNNKDLCEWKHALQQLRCPPAPEHCTRIQSTIYSCIESSFRHLESEETRYLFLHCAEKDSYILHQDLLKYCYGLGLFHGINTLEDARYRLYRQLRNLKDSCLLQDCPDDSRFCRMHDVVRDVATLIASKDYDMLFMKDDGGLKEWPDMDDLKRCKAFSIRGGDIHQLPNELECPELRFLYVNGRDRSLQIPDTFFQGMEKLKVLDLTDIKLSALPSSLLLLRNLQTLCLDHCELGDISGIGELKNLVVLSLLHSDISTLPREIGSLFRLRLLDLSNCSKLEVIPPNVLSSLVELEELYMENSFVQWEAEGLITQRSNNANLAELKSMLRLTTLEMHIRDACMLPKDLQFEKLERYNILVGDVWDWSDKHECSRTLKLKLKTSFQSEVGIKMLLNKTECLYLDELKGVKSVLHELDREGFQQLKHLHIQNNDEINYIIISSPMHISTISFPALETFLLKNMIGLEDIFHGQLHSTSLRNLRVVKVENCEKLKFVFPSSVAMGLSQLQELQIRECSNMGAIVVNEGGEIEATDMILFPQLRLLALEHLPKLMSFLRTKNSLGTEAGEIVSEGTLDFDMPIFLHEQVVFSNLESLELSSLDLEETEHNQHRARFSCRLTTMEAMTRFQNLSNLEVQGSCDKKYLLSFSTARFMVHLKHLHISECKAMEEVLVAEEIAAAREITKEVFPRLECLQLTDLPSLKRFCVGCNIQFPSLESLWIEHCPKLVTFIFNPASSGETTFQEIIQTNAEESSATAMQPLFNEEVSFPCLKKLAICRMDYLKHIWQNQFAESSFCNLQIIKVELCENLVSIFQSDMLTRFQSVEELFVIDCSSLQEVFELQELNVNENQAVTTIPLKVLFLDRLPQMKHVWSKDPKAVFSFKNLKRVRAGGCENLRSFFPASVARSLMQLEYLAIIDCGVEEIVEGEGRDICHGQLHSTFFRDLRVLKLEDCEKLRFVFSSSIARGLSLLEKLEIRRCNNMGAIVVKEEKDGIEDGDVILFPRLQTLVLENLPELASFLSTRSSFTTDGRQIIAEGNRDLHMPLLHHQVSFPSLQTLRMWGLPKIKYVWSCGQEPKTVCRCIEQLKILEIMDCGVEEIVAGRGGGGGGEPVTRTILEFPRVTDLRLMNLKRLKWFYKGVHVTKWPMLERLQIQVCDKVEIFASGVVSFEETVEERQSEMSIKQPLFLVDEVSFPSLQTLSMWGLPKIKYVWSYGQEPKTVCRCLEQLKILEIMDCGVEEIVAGGGGGGGEPVTRTILEFPRVTDLRLIYLKRLKWFYKGVHVTKWPMLEKISISGCEKVEIFASGVVSFEETVEERQSEMSIKQPLFLVDEGELHSTSFQKLRVLKLENCEKFRFVFSSSIAKGLSLLEILEIKRCNNMGAIVVKEEKDGIEDGDVILFQQLQTLVLEGLPELVSFLSTRSSFMTDCRQIIAESIRDLHMPLLHHQGEPHSTSFQKLRVLELENCEKLRFVFSSSIAKGLSLLEKLEIKRCNNMGAIVVKEEKDGIEDGDVILFPRLQTLVLVDLPELASFLSTRSSFTTDGRQIIAEGNRDLHMPLLHHQVSFPSLQTLRMRGLPKIKYVWSCGQEPKTVCRCLEQLKILEIEDCEVLEEIVAGGGGGGEPVARTILEFPRITYLRLKNLKRFKWFYKGVHVSKWPMLEMIWISVCEKVEIFASGVVSFEETVKERSSEMSIKQPLFLVDELSFSSLKKLCIWNMDKLEIIAQDQVAASSFSKNIQDVQISSCKKLLHVFQANFRTTILTTQHLTHLWIWDCKSLETIFRNMEGHNDKAPQVLIALSAGTEESVAREDGTARHIKFPILTQMTLYRLPKLKWILEGVHTNLECPSLERLELWECDQVIWASKFASSNSSQETSQQNQLWTCIQLPMPNLLELQVRSSDREEIFPYELVDPVPRLRQLHLNRLPLLTHLWKEDSTQPCPLFHDLEFLHLSRCGKLRNMVPSSVFLPNLTELHISYCDGLINLLTSSTAKTLVQLKTMTVMECKRITKIVSMEDGVANVAITFNKLAYLQLDGLPNFTQFCSEPYSFGFPSLKEVFVTCCPKMKPFCDSLSSTPKPKVVYLT